jgi:hypothetical protein
VVWWPWENKIREERVASDVRSRVASLGGVCFQLFDIFLFAFGRFKS